MSRKSKRRHRMLSVRSLLLLVILNILLCSCGMGNSADGVTSLYDTYQSSYTTGRVQSSFFAQNLCKTSDINFGTSSVNSSFAGAAGVFNMDTREVVYSQNLFEKLYPASTTKIMTAYIIIRSCDLDDQVTISENAANPGADSSVCGLKEGDVITVRDLLYGLLLPSGNDAAIALAEYYSGSVDAFVELMNETAAQLGASGTHFANSCGLPDDDHYTTVYDMYLIYSQAVLLQEFVTISGTDRYHAVYTNAKGNEVSNTWENTCRYITGYVDLPDGFTALSAKTGTTNAAGYCLCLYTENAKQQRIISIVFKGDNRADMYILMNQILKGFAN